MIPPIFQPAEVCGVTRSDGERIGVSCSLPDGSVARLSIPNDQAMWMAQSLIHYCMQAQLQSAISSGSEKCTEKEVV